ncbi:MAG: ribosome-associated translation inhibitor RaiA [Patescibacteria group bacterium]
MNIKIRSTNFELTPAIEEYVYKKLSSLDKFFVSEALCEVEIGKSTNAHKTGDIFKAEINIVGGGIDQVYVTTEEIDLYTAIDIVRDEAERSIVNKKKKKDTMIRKGGAMVKNLLKRLDFRKPR